MSEPENISPEEVLKGVVFPLVKKQGWIQGNKEIIMALRRQGLTKEGIAEKTGIPPGSLGTFLAKWSDEVRARNEKAAAELEKKAKAFDDANREAAGDEDDDDDEDVAPVGGSQKNINAAMSSEIDKQLRKGLKAAAKTVINAARGGKVDAQSLGAAKLLLKKYGMLQEEYDAKESQYAKMSSDELCDRNLAAIVVLLKSQNHFRRAEIIERAMKDLKEAREEQPAAAA